MSPRIRILASSCLAYLAVGMINASIGPLLPQLARLNGMSIAQAGLIFSAVFAGGVFSRSTAGLLGDRIGGVPVLAGGIALQAVGLAVLSLSHSMTVALAAAFFIGVATGAGLLGAVLLASTLFPERSVSAVNTVNVFYGGGSILGPALFSVSTSAWHTGFPVLWLAGLLSLAQLFVLLRASSRRASAAARTAPARTAPGGSDASQPTSVAGILLTSLFWLFGAILFFEVGVESTILGWTTVYLHGTAGISIGRAALVLAGFSVTFTSGRILAAGIGTRVPPRFLLFGGLSLALLGTLLISLSSGSLVGSTIGFLIAGLGTGPVYPTVVALIGRIFGARAGAAIGIAGSVGFAGGVVFPWLAGKLMEPFGVAAALRVVVPLEVIIILLSVMAVSVGRRRAERSQ